MCGQLNVLWSSEARQHFPHVVAFSGRLERRFTSVAHVEAPDEVSSRHPYETEDRAY
jgi:hypothetical protein